MVLSFTAWRARSDLALKTLNPSLKLSQAASDIFNTASKTLNLDHLFSQTKRESVKVHSKTRQGPQEDLNGWVASRGNAGAEPVGHWCQLKADWPLESPMPCHSPVRNMSLANDKHAPLFINYGPHHKTNPRTASFHNIPVTYQTWVWGRSCTSASCSACKRQLRG